MTVTALATLTVELEQIAADNGVELWASPGIAPLGYVDMVKGSKIFPTYSSDGGPMAYVCYFRLGNSVHAMEIPEGAAIDALPIIKTIADLKAYAAEAGVQ